MKQPFFHSDLILDLKVSKQLWTGVEAAARTGSRTVQICGERLTELWRGSMMSKETFARAVGMKRSGVFRLMRPGIHGMYADNFRKMAEVLKTTPAELLRQVAPRQRDDEKSLSKGVAGAAEALSPVPEFHGISAGSRNERLGLKVGKVHVPAELCEFAVRIDGQSMLPVYPDKALALFEHVDSQVFVYGKDYLIWFSNDECYFSRVFETDDDRDVMLLQKLNPDRTRYPDRRVHRREIVRVARCVGVLILTK